MTCQNITTQARQIAAENGASDIVLNQNRICNNLLAASQVTAEYFEVGHPADPAGSTAPVNSAVDAKPKRGRPSLYQYGDLVNLKRELLSFAADKGHPDRMPSLRELTEAKKYTVIRAIYNQGGWQAVEQLCMFSKVHTVQDLLRNPELLKGELLAYIQAHGKPGQMPQLEDLEKDRMLFLAQAIRKYGVAKLANDCGLNYAGRNQVGYWLDFAHLENEILEFVRLNGQPGVMPRLSELESAGKAYLLRPIRNFGGIREVARMMGLSGVWKRKRLPADLSAKPLPKYRFVPEALKNELLAFIEGYGVTGVMPCPHDFRRFDREDLLLQLDEYGNLRQLAKQFGLKWVIR